MEKLQRKLQNKENGNLERELSELYEILLSVSRMPYGKERKASSIRENEKQKEDEKQRKKIRMGEYKGGRRSSPCCSATELTLIDF